MNLRNFFFVATALVMVGCSTPQKQDPLPSWNETPLKQQLINYVEEEVEKIPLKDRVAVFDMDGTIACERPLWFEMAVAVQKMAERQEVQPELQELTEYQYAAKLAKNPTDTSVLNNWFVNGANYLDSVLFKSFEGIENEDYIAYAHDFLTKTDAPKY